MKEMKLRILVISYLFPNSVYPNFGIFVLNRLKALLPYCDIKVINPIPWFPFSSLLKRYRDYHLIPRKEFIAGIEVFHPRFLIIPRFLKLLDAFTFALSVLPLAFRLKKIFPHDLIDLHWTYPDLPCGFLLARLTSKKMMITVRGMEAFYSEDGGFRRFIVQWLLRKSDFLIALSEDLRKRCISMGVPMDKVVVIMNGVDTDCFHYVSRDKCRKKLGLELTDQIIISVGSLTHRKGFDRLIKFFPGILCEYPKSKLYIIGSRGQEDDNGGKLLQLVQSLRIGGHVRFIGEVSNNHLVYWYNAADIFCLASRDEGSPNVLNEALACGCPVLATDVGTVSEILNEETMGEVVANSSEVFHYSLSNMLSRQFDRRKIAAHMKMFNWDWCARRVLEVYRDVLN